jgi:phospho-N-acetylmuramoyl-pentapeptide-transferase
MRFIVALVASWLAVGFFTGLARRRGWGQSVRRDGLQTHLVKDGTPTMGGVPFGLLIFIVWLVMVGLPGLSDEKGWAAVIMSFCMGLIGFLDDYAKVRSRMTGEGSTEGLQARLRLPLQILVALVFSIVAARHVWVTNIFWIDVAFYTFITVGTVNAVNFTDGIDGQAAGVVAIILLPLAVASPLAAITIGSLVGYLWYNSRPASIFMGDAGSYALGGVVAGVYIIHGWSKVLPFAAIIPVLEVLSVMIQVTVFQYTKRTTGTGRRVFLMTPIHHHFEKAGMQEVKIASRFWVVTALGTAVAWAIRTGAR